MLLNPKIAIGSALILLNILKHRIDYFVNQYMRTEPILLYTWCTCTVWWKTVCFSHIIQVFSCYHYTLWN